MIEGAELLQYVDDAPTKVTAYLREIPVGQGKGALLNKFEDQIPEELEVAEMYGAGRYILIVAWSVEETPEGSTKKKTVHKTKTESYNISERAGFSHHSVNNQKDERLDRLEGLVLKMAETPKSQDINPLDIVKLMLTMQNNNSNGSDTIKMLEEMYIGQMGQVMEKGREMQTLAHEQSLELTKANNGNGGKKSLLEYVEEYIPVIQGFLKMPMGASIAKSQLANNPEISALMKDPDQIEQAKSGLSKHFSPEEVEKINSGFFPKKD